MTFSDNPNDLPVITTFGTTDLVIVGQGARFGAIAQSNLAPTITLAANNAPVGDGTGGTVQAPMPMPGGTFFWPADGSTQVQNATPLFRTRATIPWVPSRIEGETQAGSFDFLLLKNGTLVPGADPFSIGVTTGSQLLTASIAAGDLIEVEIANASGATGARVQIFGLPATTPV